MKRSSVVILVALGGTAALAYGLSHADRCAQKDPNGQERQDSQERNDACRSSSHSSGWGSSSWHSSGGSTSSSGSRAVAFGGFGHAGSAHGSGS